MLMLIGLFAACGGTNEPQQSAATDGSQPTTPATDPSTAPSTDGTTDGTTTPQAAVDVTGYEFYLGNPGGFRPEEGTANGDELADIYAEIEERLGCTINFNDPASGSDPEIEPFLTAISGGENLADFIRCRQFVWIPLAVNSGLRPLDTEEVAAAGLELNNEDNFNQYYTHLSDFMGHTWGVDMSGKYDRMSFGHCYAFNKTLTEQAGYTDEMLFQAVRDGEWTYDLFLEIAGKISADTDGDGTNDYWGVALDCDGNEVWTNGDGPIIYDEAAGKWVANLGSEKVVKALEFMNAVSGDPFIQLSLEGDAVASRGDRRNNFYAGLCGFAGLYGPNFGKDGTFNMEDPVGLLPMPKGPDAETYIMNFVDTDAYVCMITNQDWEKSMCIMNEIGKAVTDYDEYQTYIMDSLQNDEGSFEMLFEYCLPNSMMNIAKCSEEMYQITRYEFYDAVYKGTLTPRAAAETYQSLIQNELDNVFKQD